MTSSILLKKQEELNARLVRDLLRLPENKKCFDCPTKSPFFVNVTLQTFICSRCSGLIREVGHRVKSISASKFTGPELTALEHGGNGIATKIWLSCGYNAVDTPEPESDGEVRAFMRQKYYEKKWLNRDLAVSHDLFVKSRIDELFTEEGLPKKQHQQRHRRSTIDSNSNSDNPMTFDLPQHQRLKNVPSPLNLSSTNKVHQPAIQTAPLMMNSLQPQPKLSSPKLHKDDASTSPSLSSSASVPVSPAPTTSSNASSIRQPTTPMDSIFSDLAGLTLTHPPPTQSSPSYPCVTTSSITNRRATYTGGILTPTNKINTKHDEVHSNDKRSSIQPTTTISAPRVTTTEDASSVSNHKRTTSLQADDPYSALRAHHEQEQLRHQQMVSAIMATSQSSSALYGNDQMKKQNKDDDRYAALRQLSGETNDLFNHTLAIQPSTSSTWSSPPPSQPHHQVSSSTKWPSSPTPEPQQSAASLSREQHHVPLWKDKSYATTTTTTTTATDEWVDAEPFDPEQEENGDEDDDEDVMTQISSTTTYSTTSSTKSHKVNSAFNAFSDLDPLANLKRNKSGVATTTSST